MYRTKAVPKNRSPDKVFWKPAERILGMVHGSSSRQDEVVPDEISSEIKNMQVSIQVLANGNLVQGYYK
jgi:hypothetical protein